MKPSRIVLAAALLGSLSCTHTDPFVATGETNGPFSAGSDVQLSFNSDQDYWPTWTQDGRGILYAFVDAEAATAPKHRCLGMLPAAGGTRIWQLCDNRAVRNDTLSSYGAYALSSDGRLLVAEATAPAVSQAELFPSVTLWLADTAHPYVRTQLLKLPQSADGFGVTWLADLSWTGPNTFIALGQQYISFPRPNIIARDSV